MISSHVIIINEVDDAEDAVALVREKMAKIELKKNSFGIVSAYPDAIYSGVYEAVCNELPFEVAGIACDDQCANGEIGLYMLSIMILTGDDCGFVCGSVDNISDCERPDEAVKDCYVKLKSELGDTPKLALMYTHFKSDCITCEYINAISSTDEQLPVFGSVANAKDTFESRNGALTLCDKRALDDSVVLVLVSGEFTPMFFVSTFGEDAIVMRDVGVATKCERNMLLEINGVKATDFLEKAGFSKSMPGYSDSRSELMSSTFVLDYSEDSEMGEKQLVSRQPVTFTEEGVLCAGIISEGARISVAFSTPASVMDTAREVTRAIKKSGGKTALMYSCIGRQVGLLSDTMRELEAIREDLAYDINYIATYAYGEISPTLVTASEDGVAVRAYNHSHNQTLIACVF
jgi:hypothetical protein